MMRRLLLTGSFSFLSLTLGLAVTTAYAQVQPPPGGGGMPPPAGGGAGGGVVPPGAGIPPPGGAMPPPAGGGGGGGVIPPGVVPPGAGGGMFPPAVGNLGIGAIPVTPPPPIGYYAPARPANYNMGKFFYYPFYYYPHSYWPTQTCQWPERPGEPYMRPPAYMTYPPFLEPHWRYEWAVPQKHYRGFHFWLDQF